MAGLFGTGKRAPPPESQTVSFMGLLIILPRVPVKLLDDILAVKHAFPEVQLS
jgi:hypothetical protein